MAFIEPNADPIGVGAALTENPGLPPIVSNLPNAQKSYARKYTPTQVAALHQYFDKNVVSSFLDFEKSRVAKGQYPLTSQQAIKVMAAAQKKTATTKAPTRDAWDVLGNIAGDVGNIVTSIPKMPTQIAHDVYDIPNIAKRIQQGGGGLGGILNAPVIRLIPGAYTARNVATGDIHEIVTHPVMSALDVLPYTKALKLGEHLGDINLPGTSPTGLNTVRDVKTAATQALGRTQVGQAARNIWDPTTRGVSKEIATGAHEMLARMNPAMRKVYDDGLSRTAMDSVELAQRADRLIPDDARRAEVFHAYETDQLDNPALNITDHERAAVQLADQGARMQQQYHINEGSILERQMNGQTEQLLPTEAARLDTINSRIQHRTTMTTLREAIVNQDADPTALVDDVKKTLADPLVKVAKKKDVLAGFVHAMDRAGYDTGSALSDVSKARGANLPTPNDILTAAGAPVEGALRVRRRTGDPALESSDRWLEKNRQYTPKTLDSTTRRMQQATNRIVPARWQPIFQDMKVEKAAGRIEQTFDPTAPEYATLMNAVHEHTFAGMDPADIKAIDAEILAEIPKLRAQGVDPKFMHHVSYDQTRALSHPTITSLNPSPAQLKARVNDWTPHVDSFSVSLTHGALELLKRDQTSIMLDHVEAAYTKSVTDAEQELGPAARRASNRNGTDYRAELERLVRKEYATWENTKAGFRGGGKFQSSDLQLKPEPRLIPKHLARALEQVATPPVYSRVLDPVTKTFRVSVLPFSPRFHLNNILGGAIMVALEDPTALLKFPDAWKLSREWRKMSKAMASGDEFTFSDRANEILTSMDPRMRAQLGSLQYGVAPDDLFKVRGGGTMAKWAQDAGVKRLVAKGVDAGSAAVNWSMGINELWDDTYRLSAYLSDFDKGIKKGLSPVESDAAGMALANKVVPRWLEMTPIERSVFRAVAPFYSFMSHIFRYAMRYPIDHPWRTSVLAGLTRAEETDAGTGLPGILRNMFFIGSPDAHGNQQAVDIGAANPFRDLGDQLTLAGFLGQTNPVFKTALRAIGYDPDSRSPNLYPDVEYDSSTGQFKQVNPGAPNLLGKFASDIIPQTAIIGQLLGTSSEFKQLLRTNPSAASRMLLSESGVPNIYKSVPVYQDIFKGELNRQTAQQQVFATALKTGDYSRAWDYPELRPQIRALVKLNKQGVLSQYIAGAPNVYLQQTATAAPATPLVGSASTTQAEVRASGG